MAKSRLPKGKCRVLRFGEKVVKICRTPDGKVIYEGPYHRVELSVSTEEYSK